MKQANLTKKHNIEIQDVAELIPRDKEVIISVAACGICGSDIHAFEGKHPFMPAPLVMGHEFSGVVTRYGSAVKKFKGGERVVVEPTIVCGECYNCKLEKYNLCKEIKIIGCQTPGAYSEEIAVPEDKVISIPDKMSFAEGALVEPAAVAYHTISRAKIDSNEKILIIGAGPIGLFVLQTLKAKYRVQVMICDINDFRLKTAEKLGADIAVNNEKENIEKKIKTAFGEDGHDITFECVGIGAAFDLALKLARRGSRISAVGIYGPKENLSCLAYISEHELEISGNSIYLKTDFEQIIQLFSKGKLNAKEIITHRFPLLKVKDAFELIINKRGNFIKVLLEIN
jgi:L-iditol 2-dehydrogenase